MLKATAGGGGRGIRMVDLRRRADRRVRADPRRGGARLRQRRGLPRAPGHRRPARRGPGDRRRPGHRVGARRPRLLGPAPQPEGHRGVRRPGAVRRAGRRSSRPPPSGWPSRSATPAPAPSSSSTTPASKFFAFLEVNTRLQVEHPITEVTTDTDLVKAQIHVAGGGRLEGERPVELGHAVEARLNAEDPDRDFAPSPGRIALLDLPAGPGIRVDTGVGEGDSIPADFDSMIAKIIAFGRDRDEALARLRRAMRRDHRRHRGRRDQQELRARPARPARGHRRQRPTPAGSTGSAPRAARARHRHSGVALVAAGIEAYEDEGRSSAPACSRPPAAAGRRSSTRSAGPSTSSCAASRYKVTVCADRARTGSASPSPRRRDEQVVDAEIERLDEYTSRLTVGGQQLPPGHRHPRPGPAGRGRRRDPPGEPRRGRRAALPGAGPGGGDAGRGRRRGRGRRAGAGAGER